MRKPLYRHRRRKTADKDTSVIVTTQSELDSAVQAPAGMYILGGTPTKPLVLQDKCFVRPVIGDGACVMLKPRNSSQPPDVLVMGDDANVVAVGTARVECRGDSTIRLKHRAKGRIYHGTLIAGGHTRSYLYGNATAILWDHARCFLRNQTTAQCYMQSRAFLFHEAQAHLWTKSARAWKKNPYAKIRRLQWD